MTTEKRHIRMGRFDNFKGEDSILISVDIEGLIEFEEVFLKLANGLSSFDFSNLYSIAMNLQSKILAD